jgi:AraC-like DNA-binding protein
LDIRARFGSIACVLHARTILTRDGVSIADVACRHGAGRGAPEEVGGHRLVFVRRGSFVRSADGARAVLDPTVAYATTPGQEERFDHAHGHGDDCTALGFDAALVAALWGGDAVLPAGALRTGAAADLEHRLLLAAARRGEDRHALVEHAIALAAVALEGADAPRVAAGRPATARARRALADGAREALATDPDRALPDLARALGASPHHLSRVFRATTGRTVAAHRMALRARDALERLAGGERDLARLAADAGFADQSHLTRVLRRETGTTPAALRAALAYASSAPGRAGRPRTSRATGGVGRTARGGSSASCP